MPNVHANGIDIEYEEFGNPSDPALLLIMGFTAQMIAWDEAFCRQLADRGFRVIRFDNRDVGLSSKIEGGPEPDVAAAREGDGSSASYGIDDMAADAAGLLDALGIDKAHIVGASMGGFIAQTFAMNHPDKTLSLCSIMSSTGNPDVGQPSETAMAALMTPQPESREEALDRAVAVSKIIGAPGFPFDEARIRDRAARAYDRMFYPPGILRQMMAIATQPDRTEALGNVNVPALVVHGAADPLINPSGGEATAKAIPGADLLMVEGMGHDLPEGAWPQVIDAIAANAGKAAAK